MLLDIRVGVRPRPAAIVARGVPRRDLGHEPLGLAHRQAASSTTARSETCTAWSSSPARARAWPSLIAPVLDRILDLGRERRAGAACWRSTGRDAADTRRPTCSWVSPNSSMSRWKARASSIALRSERWRFSTSASSRCSCSSAERTTAGIGRSPASAAARTRRSPAMSMIAIVAPRSTRTGCRTPCSCDAVDERALRSPPRSVPRGWSGLAGCPRARSHAGAVRYARLGDGDERGESAPEAAIAPSRLSVHRPTPAVSIAAAPTGPGPPGTRRARPPDRLRNSDATDAVGLGSA